MQEVKQGKREGGLTSDCFLHIIWIIQTKPIIGRIQDVDLSEMSRRTVQMLKDQCIPGNWKPVSNPF